MRTAALIARILVGLVFLTTGVNHFYKFMDTPPPPSDTAKQFVMAMAATEYMTVVKVLEVSGALLLLSGRFVPLGVVLLAPVAVNIALYELVFGHVPGPGGRVNALVGRRGGGELGGVPGATVRAGAGRRGDARAGGAHGGVKTCGRNRPRRAKPRATPPPGPLPEAERGRSTCQVLGHGKGF